VSCSDVSSFLFEVVHVHYYSYPNLNDGRETKHAACMGQEMHTKFWSENLKERDHLEDLGMDRRIILEWILDKQDGNMRIGFNLFRIVSSILF
jgi:hypothetical protein